MTLSTHVCIAPTGWVTAHTRLPQGSDGVNVAEPSSDGQEPVPPQATVTAAHKLAEFFRADSRVRLPPSGAQLSQENRNKPTRAFQGTHPQHLLGPLVVEIRREWAQSGQPLHHDVDALTNGPAPNVRIGAAALESANFGVDQ